MTRFSGFCTLALVCALLLEGPVSCVSRPDLSDDDSLGGAPNGGRVSSGGQGFGGEGGFEVGAGGKTGAGAGAGGARTQTGGESSVMSGGGPTGGNSAGGAATGGMGGETNGACAEPDALRTFALQSLMKKPLVYVLVDVSTSMFDTEGAFALLEDGVLPALEERESALRLGFGTSSGETALDCTGLTNLLPVGDDNASELRAAYEALSRSAERVNSPTSLSIQQATELLAPSAKDAPVALVLYSDGDSDFCDDSNPTCALDAQITTLQMAADRGITTIMVAGKIDSVPDEWMDFLAQAGAGEEPAWDDGLDVGEYLGSLEAQCKNYPAWVALRDVHGNAPHSECGLEPDISCHFPAGHYSSSGGTDKAIAVGEASAVEAALGARLDAIEGCSFALPDEVAPGQFGLLEFFVNDRPLQLHDRLLGEGYITVRGDACAELLQGAAELVAKLPCSVPLD